MKLSGSRATPDSSPFEGSHHILSPLYHFSDGDKEPAKEVRMNSVRNWFLTEQNVLFVNLTEGIDKGRWPCIRIKRNCPLLSHLFFTDDSIFFCKMQKKTISFLSHTLEEFGRALVKLVNLVKSGIMLSANVSKKDIDWISQRLKVKHMDPNARYLGLPTLFGRSKGNLWTI